jgi:dihydrofolate reductase/thymidylate synthase
MTNFSIIAAVDQKLGLGKDGRLAWHLPEDLKYFHRITRTTEDPGLENAVIMGHRTWESLPSKARPLAGRINCVISTSSELDLPDGVLQFDSLDEALTALATSDRVEQVFVIGGATLYAEAILHPDLERIYLTRIEADYECDVFFPEKIPEDFEIVSATETMESDGLEYSMVVLEREVDHSKDQFFEFGHEDNGADAEN